MLILKGGMDMAQDGIDIIIKIGFNAMTIIALGLLALALYLDFYLPIKRCSSKAQTVADDSSSNNHKYLDEEVVTITNKH